jgi:hypothetical protein
MAVDWWLHGLQCLQLLLHLANGQQRFGHGPVQILHLFVRFRNLIVPFPQLLLQDFPLGFELFGIRVDLLANETFLAFRLI